MNHWGYLTVFLLLAVTVLTTMDAAGTRRTCQAEVAWQAEKDRKALIDVAVLADKLAAQGSPHPGSAAVAMYQDQHRRTDHYR